MSKPHQLFTTLIIISVFFVSLSYEDFRFSRDISCNKIDAKGICQDWNQTTTLYRYSTSLYYCFPADAYVRTSKGPLQFKQLKLEDELFAINLKTGKNQFAPLTAWLHRDTTSLMDYSLIQLQNSPWDFVGSSYHNVAFSSQNGIDFKFLKDLQPNDTLVSISATGQTFKVQTIQKHMEKQGLYSPLTKTGTFYIYPENFDIQKFNQNEDAYPMVLVHCLSQVIDPTKYQYVIDNYVALTKNIFGSHQPEEEENYVSPLVSTFSILFGQDWVSVEGQQIAHRYSSSSSYRQQEREQRKRKTMAVIALQTVLGSSLL